MNFGLTPLCSESLCNNDSLLPTHTPALRVGMTASKPNTRVAGETCGRLDSSSLYRYMKYIWGTPAILRVHSLAELMLVEHCCRHQGCSSLELWSSTSSSFPGWQMEIPGNEINETPLKGWYSHSDYLKPNMENMPKASLLWITVKCSIRGWIYRKPAVSKGSPWSSVSQASWGVYSDLQIRLHVQAKLLPQSPILNHVVHLESRCCHFRHSTSLESLYSPETEGCKQPRFSSFIFFKGKKRYELPVQWRHHLMQK